MDFASFGVFRGQVQPLFLETKKPGIQARPLRHMKNVDEGIRFLVRCQSPELVTWRQRQQEPTSGVPCSAISGTLLSFLMSAPVD